MIVVNKASEADVVVINASEEERDKHLVLLRITGHAQYSAGNDIVCAGVSAIAYAFLGYLQNFPLYEAKESPCANEQGLFVRIYTTDPGILAAYEMAVIGLMQIAAKYPDNVCVVGY